MGLYAVLWGKNKETKPANAIEEIEATKIDDDMIAKDLEMQFDAKSNGNHNKAENPEDMQSNSKLLSAPSHVEV